MDPTQLIDEPSEMGLGDKVELIDSMMKQAGASRDVHMLARKSLVSLRDEVVRLRAEVDQMKEALSSEEEIDEATQTSDDE